VADYLALGVQAGDVDLETVSQLLRASSAGAPVVDALLRVLESERVDRAGATQAAAPATSLLRDSDPTPDTGEHIVPQPAAPSAPAPPAPSGPHASDDGKTQRKPYPTAPRRRGEPGKE
jgi:hypothetical protein